MNNYKQAKSISEKAYPEESLMVIPDEWWKTEPEEYDFGMFISDLMAKEHPEIAKEKSEDHLRFLAGKLTAELLQRELRENRDKNIILSPFSILSLVSVAAFSAAGKTKEEILRTFGFGEIAPVLLELQTALTKTHRLFSANAVCVQEKYSPFIRPEYREKLKQYFKGEVFSSENIVGDVNRWVSKKTRGMIPSVLDESTEEIDACMMNAVAFEDRWMDTYDDDDIRDDEFVNSDKSRSTVRMMSGREEDYIEDPDFTGFVKPYRQGDFSFLALLPKKEGPLYPGKMPDFSTLFRNRSEAIVLVKIPEFQCSSGIDLTDYLKSKGLQTAFTPSADFSPVATFPLRFEKIAQKAHIEVDRNGTKAAAVTYSTMIGMGFQPVSKINRVYLDRPFYYAIIHNHSAVPVFAGAVNALPSITDA